MRTFGPARALNGHSERTGATGEGPRFALDHNVVCALGLLRIARVADEQHGAPNSCETDCSAERAMITLFSSLNERPPHLDRLDFAIGQLHRNGLVDEMDAHE